MDIDKLIIEFENYAGDTESKLKDVLSIVSAGCIPDKATRDELNSVIKVLCEKYESVKSIAEAELSKEELPKEGSPAFVYYAAIKNSKAALIRARLNEIEDTLTRFISVQSLIARYAAALDPIQAEAALLLEKIHAGNTSEIDEISEKAAGPQLFMKALDCPDLNTDEGNDMLDSLSDDFNYSPYVIRGLLSKSYFVGETKFKEEATTNTKTQIMQEESLPEATAKEETTEMQKANAPSPVNEETQEEKNAPEVECTETISPFRKALEEKKIALSDKDYGIFTKEASSSETKKVTSSIFVSDMRKGDIRACKCILRELDYVPVLSPELLDAHASMPEAIGSSALDFLQKKGYLLKYKVYPGGEFYCPSPRLRKALTFKESARFAGLRQHGEEEWGAEIEPTAARISARAAYLKLNTSSIHAHNVVITNDFENFQSLMTEAFILKRREDRAPKSAELFAGAFYTNYDEADEFADILLSYLADIETVGVFIFAATNKKTAKAIVDEIIKLAPEKLRDNIYLYDVSLDKCFSYDTNDEAEADDVIAEFLSSIVEPSEDIVEDIGGETPEEDASITAEPEISEKTNEVYASPNDKQILPETVSEDVDSISAKSKILTRREQEIPHLYRWRDELR